MLLDDLDNPVGARFDQNRAAVHDRVTIIPSAIFRRHVVIGDAVIGQDSANPDLLTVLIGGTALIDNIAVKAGTLVDAQDPVDATDHAANHPSNDAADRTGGSFAVP